MERLTGSSEEIKTLTAENEEYWLKVYFKLKEYEEAEEQGLLEILPCKIGDVLYYRSSCVIKELIVREMRIRKHCIDVFTEDIKGEKYAFSSGVIGKAVFWTRKEAEAELAEMEG